VGDFDITTLILSEHEAFRRAFTEVEALTEPAELERRWRELADGLEVHAAGEEEVFYPELLQDVDDSEGDTEHAVKDHNEIRDAVRKAREHEVGTDGWWTAVWDARKANDDHMGEEEREDLLDFRRHADLQTRHEIAVQFLTFEAEHYAGIPIRDKDPERYVADNR
jgi:Hemerythrin HHE cation binding domain